MQNSYFDARILWHSSNKIIAVTCNCVIYFKVLGKEHTLSDLTENILLISVSHHLDISYFLKVMMKPSIIQVFYYQLAGHGID